jgi:hypothetical protein
MHGMPHLLHKELVFRRAASELAGGHAHNAVLGDLALFLRYLSLIDLIIRQISQCFLLTGRNMHRSQHMKWRPTRCHNAHKWPAYLVQLGSPAAATEQHHACMKSYQGSRGTDQVSNTHRLCDAQSFVDSQSTHGRC